MLPFIWLAFHVWFVWMSPGFVHNDDSSKKVITFPLVPVLQGLCDCIVVPLLYPGNFMGVSNALQIYGNPECHAECGAQFCDILRLLLLIHAQSIIDQHPTGNQGVELFPTWSRPVQRLSWMASVPSRKTLTQHATVRYGNAALPHASRSSWKHSCVLLPRTISILIQGRFSSFINMSLGHLHYPYENQSPITLEYIDRLLSPLAALTHLTVLVHIHKTGSSRTHHRHVTSVLLVLFIQTL